MTIKTDGELQAAFAGREAKPDAPALEVPERIRKDAPTPVLRPGGSWVAMADAVDQGVREAQDAAKARQNEWAARKKTGEVTTNEWAARIKSRRRGKGYGMGE
jgi:hypothetical protein